MSLVTCMKKAGAALHPEDKKKIISLARSWRSSGLSADDAGRRAIEQHIRDLENRMAIRPEKSAAPIVPEQVAAGDKGVARLRSDKSIKEYLSTKRPADDDTERLIDYRTQTVVGYNEAVEAGADRNVVDFLRGENTWAMDRLKELAPDVHARFAGASTAPEGNEYPKSSDGYPLVPTMAGTKPNEHGVFFHAPDAERFEMPVGKKERNHASIEVLQLKDGRWVYGHHSQGPLGGGAGSPSVHGGGEPSRELAIDAALTRVERSSGPSTTGSSQAWIAKVKKWTQSVRDGLGQASAADEEPVKEVVQRNPQKAADIARRRMALDPENDTLLQALAKMGGLRREVAKGEWGLGPEELKQTVQLGGLKGYPFRATGGMAIDDAITRLAEAGYFHGVPEEDWAHTFEDRVSDELGGNPHYSMQGQMRQAQKRSEEDAQLHALESRMTEQPALAQHEMEELGQRLDEAGIHYDDTRELTDDDLDVAINSEGEPEIIRTEADHGDEETYARADSGQAVGHAPGEAPPPRDAAGGRAGPARAGGGEEEGLTLSAQTEGDLRERADRAKAAAAADKAEQQRLANRDQADAERGDFALTGSDRAVDVAAAHGQGDLLAAPAEKPTTIAGYPKENLQPGDFISVKFPATKEHPGGYVRSGVLIAIDGDRFRVKPNGGKEMTVGRDGIGQYGSRYVPTKGEGGTARLNREHAIKTLEDAGVPVPEDLRPAAAKPKGPQVPTNVKPGDWVKSRSGDVLQVERVESDGVWTKATSISEHMRTARFIPHGNYERAEEPVKAAPGISVAEQWANAPTNMRREMLRAAGLDDLADKKNVGQWAWGNLSMRARAAMAKGRPTEKSSAADDISLAKPAVSGSPVKELTKTAEKLREAGQKLIEAGGADYGRDRLANTARRARMASSAEASAAHTIYLGKKMVALADALADGRALALRGVSTKAAIEQIDNIRKQAQYDTDRHLGYGEQEKRKGRSFEPGDLANVKYPNAEWNSGAKESLLRELEAVKGKYAKEAKALAKDVRGSREADSNQLQSAKLVLGEKAALQAIGWWVPEAIAGKQRLQRAGIENVEQLRDAVRDYVGLDAAPAVVDKVRELERALVGSKVGVDFFPTPPVVADKIIADHAQLRAGLRVLEPSAGNGNIADAIRRAGVEPDTVELSDALRQILEAKGHKLVGRDFLDYKPGAVYDRIIMNPPFGKGAEALDRQHVEHAYTLLAPGGRLVAIMGEGTFGRGDLKSQRFNAEFLSHAKDIEKLPAGTFNDPRLPATTGTAARVVVIEKPASNIARQERKLYRVEEPGESGDLFGVLPPAPRKGPIRIQGTEAPAIPVEQKFIEGVKPNAVVIRPNEALPGAYNVTSQLVSVGQMELPAGRVTTMGEAVQALHRMSRFSVEHFDALVTDIAGKPLAVVGSFKGATTQTSVYPATVLGEALRIKGATDIWGVHNHPSGTPALSRADEFLSGTFAVAFKGTRVRWRGLAAIGGAGQWSAVDETGNHTFGAIDVNAPVKATVPVMERTLIEARNPQRGITSPAEAKDFSAQLSGGKPGLLLLDAQNSPSAWVPLDGLVDKLGKMADTGLPDMLVNSVTEAGAAAVIMTNPSDVVPHGAVDNIGRLLRRLDVRLIDVIDTDTMSSAAEKGTLAPPIDTYVLSAADGRERPIPTVMDGHPAPDDVARVAAMARELNEGNRGDPIFGRAVQMDAVAPGEGTHPERAAEMQAVDTIARRLFGTTATFVKFREGTRALFNGLMLKKFPGQILLNADAAHPLLAVLGHELLHEMRRKYPDLYAALKGKLDDLIQNSTGFYEELASAYRAQGVDFPNQWSEELHGDIVGDRFIEPQFWREMAADKPGLFQRVINAVQSFLARVRDRLAGITGLGSDQYLRDIDAARTAVADAMREFSRRQTEGGEEGVNLEGAETADEAMARLSIARDFSEMLRAVDQHGIRHSFEDALRSHSDHDASVWEKTVGTQYAKAQQHPEFRPVFDHIQDFIKDVSLYAHAAANKAPDILPRLDGFRDALPAWLGGKTRAAKEDMAAAADAIFGGTLNLERYDRAQLLEMGLSDKQADVYEQAIAAAHQSLDDVSKAEFVKMGGNLAEFVRPYVMNAPTLDDAARVMSEYLAENGDQETAEKVLKRAERVAQMKAEGYFPLMRFGLHTLTIRDKGNSVFFRTYDSRLARNREMRALQEDPAFDGADFQAGKMTPEEFKLYKGLSMDSIEAFAKAAGLTDDEAFQAYLRTAVSTRSALKRLIHRKGTAGFSEDIPRVLAGFITSNARLASRSNHMAAAIAAAQDIPQHLGDLKTEAIKLIEYMQNPVQEANGLRGLLFASYIGGSAASALVNMTQPITMTLPYLSRWGGLGKATGHLFAAAALAVKDDAQLPPELRAALERATDVVKPQEIHSLVGEADQGTASWVRRASLVWGSGFQLAEQFNRRVSFLAAYQTAKEHGIADPQAFAERAVIETQGLYNKGNRPDWARGAIGGTVMTFKQFSIHYLEWLGRMWQSGPEGKKSAAYAVAILLATAGVGGLPFAQNIDDIADTVGQAMGLDFSLKRVRRKFIAETLGWGRGVADLAERGVSAAAGMPIDVSVRMGLGKLLPATGILLRSETDKLKDVSELAGAAGSLGLNVIKGAGTALAGEPLQGAKAVAPLAVQNAIRAVDMWQSGQYKTDGGKLVKEVSKADAVVKGIGFQPADIAGESALVGEATRSAQLLRATEKAIVSKWAQGLAEGDFDKVRDAQGELRSWNEKNPQEAMQIPLRSVVQAVRQMRETREQRTLQHAPKGQRAFARDILQE